MDSMAVLLEAAADDIKLIDCLGPEDLCYDPTSADGLKPLQPRALRSRRPAAAAGVAAAVKSVLGSATAVKVAAKRITLPKIKAEHNAAPVQEEAQTSPALYRHSSANAELAAALSRGEFYGPTSPLPVSQRLVPEAPTREASPQPTPADVPLPRQPSPKPASRPATRGNASKLEPVPAQTVHNPAGSEKSASRGSSANPATRVQRFAAAVLRYIFSNMQDGQQQTLESVIRREFGNTPDISKALRLLVTEKNVRRAGKGGRAEPFTYQLAAKAIKYMQEHQTPPLPDATEAAAATLQATFVVAQHAAPTPLQSLKQEANNAACTHAMRADKLLSADRLQPRPVSSLSGLRRSASMPSLTNNQRSDQLAVQPTPETAVSMHKHTADQAAMAQQQHGKCSPGKAVLAADSLNAAALNDHYAAVSVPTAVSGNWVPAAPFGTSVLDSIMSNSPKESTASIALPSPFAIFTNTDYLKHALTVPQSYLYTETALRDSMTSSAGNRKSSLFTHREKENSPKSKAPYEADLPSTATNENVNSLAGVSSKVQGGTAFAQNTSMSGTVSAHALSAKHCRSGSSQMQAYSSMTTEVSGVRGTPAVLQERGGLQDHENSATKRCRLH